MAPRQPATSHGPATRWSLDALVTALLPRRPCTLSRSSVWRMLEEADLKPPRSVYGLHSHDADFDAKAHAMCSLSINARRFFEPGRVVIGSDEKTGRPMLERQSPTPPLAPGKPAKREHESLRPGTRALMASCVGATGQGRWNLGQPRTSTDVASHLAHGVKPLPDMHRDDGVVDHLKTHWSLDVCRVVAPWCQVPLVAQDWRHGVQRRAFLSDPRHTPVCHFTPKHGSWLNQVAWWLSVLARRFLQRGDCCSAQDFATRLSDYLEVSNTHQAHPYRWTYTGQPLVRATPFSHTRHQQRQGRAWFSPRPQRFERAFYPPRPYKRAAA